MVVHPGNYVRITHFVGWRKIRVVGRVGKLSPKFGVWFDEVIDVEGEVGRPDATGDELRRAKNNFKILLTQKWLKPVAGYRQLNDEEVLGYKL